MSRSSLKRPASLILASSVFFGGLVFSPILASAEAAVCGFQGTTTSHLGGGDDGYYERATYTNCTKKKQHISVKYTYASRGMCVTPGKTTLYANPDLGALRGAKALGKC